LHCLLSLGFHVQKDALAILPSRTSASLRRQRGQEESCRARVMGRKRSHHPARLRRHQLHLKGVGERAWVREGEGLGLGWETRNREPEQGSPRPESPSSSLSLPFRRRRCSLSLAPFETTSPVSAGSATSLFTCRRTQTTAGVKSARGRTHICRIGTGCGQTSGPAPETQHCWTPGPAPYCRRGTPASAIRCGPGRPGPHAPRPARALEACCIETPSLNWNRLTLVQERAH